MITRFSRDFQPLHTSPARRELLDYVPEEMIGTHPSAARRLEDGSRYVAVTRNISERKALEAQLEDANQRFRALAREDALTGLPNRRRFDEALAEEYRRVMPVHSPLAVIMLDMDQFKSFNDAYGHPSGNACLKALAATINSLTRRPADLPARYGGGELVTLLPDTDAIGALASAERLCAAVRSLEIPPAGSDLGLRRSAWALRCCFQQQKHKVRRRWSRRLMRCFTRRSAPDGIQ